MRRMWLLILVACLGCQAAAERPRIPLPATPQPIASVSAENGDFANKLILLEQLAYPDSRIKSFDSATLSQEILFETPTNGWINQIAQHPTDGRLLLAYTPPAADGDLVLDRSGLYWLENGTLNPLLIPDAPNIYYYTPTFSPDGRTLFFVQTIISGGIQNLDVSLIRYELATGVRSVIDQDGIWPRVSPDGEWLSYIHVETEILQRSLVVSRLDGSERRVLVPAGLYFDLDTPLFSADSSTIYFTVAPYAAESRTLFDRLTGVHSAHAHANQNIPSAWWRIPLSGGSETQVTAATDIILHGSFNASGDTLYFSTVTGLYALSTGENTVLRLAENNAYRTVLIR